MASFSSIKASIKTKLETITGLENVSSWERGQIEGYPSAVISGFELISNEWSDNDSNQRIFDFKVRIYQEMESEAKGAEEAEDILDALVDDIVDAFNDDRTLSNTVIGAWITGASGWADRELNMRILEFSIKVKTMYDLT